MDLHHGTEGDQTHQGVLGNEGKGHKNSVLQGLELILRETGVYHEEVHWGEGVLAHREGILNCGIVGNELSGKIGFADVCIVGWELVALVAYRAHPQFSTHINSAIGIQHRVARALAIHRLIGDLERTRLVFLQGRV
jgi:hypothetical protein